MGLNLLQVLVRSALLLGFVVVALGAYTRLAGAGLGCPDWPLCYGHLIMPSSAEDIANANATYPDNSFQPGLASIEVLHRVVAGSLGVLILIVALCMSWHSAKNSNISVNLPLRLSWLCVLVVAGQALLGMWTVTLKLWPQVVTAHLLGGFSILALLLLLELRLSRQFTYQASITLTSWENYSGIKFLGWLVFLLLLAQIALGGWVSSNYAALACLDFPTCNGRFWPKMDFNSGFNFTQSIGPNYLGGQLDNEARVAIHYSHRLNAVLLLALSLLLFWRCHSRGIAAISRAANRFLLVLGLQISLGIANVLLYLPLSVAVAHNVFGALLLLSTVNLLYRLHELRPIKGSNALS